MKVIRWILIIFVLLFAFIFLVGFFAFKEKGIEKDSVLKLTISEDIQDWTLGVSFPFPFGKKKLSLYDYVNILKDAEKNEKIKGLYVRIKPFEMGGGKIEELISAIKDFKKSGKKSFCYTETFGEFGPANGAYWLASSVDKIYINPKGYLNLIGINSEVPFIRGTLDKLHIYPDFDHMEEYKTAMNIITEKKFTDAHREMQESLVNSIFDNMVSEISKNRNIPKEELISIINLAPLSAKEALNYKLVDGLLYEDELESKFKELAGEDYHLVNDFSYKVQEDKGSDKIAIIFGMGGIFVGKSEAGPFGQSGMGSETIAKYFREARKDKSIKAVVFRVDSGGGSAIGSEIIRRELNLTKKEKPVVVSMSDLAGSGGYWVSMSASSIIAHPSTFTGSIGVVVGKFNMKGFWEDLIGMTFDRVKKGEMADFYSSLQNFTPNQKVILKKMMEEIYEDFVNYVSQDRNIPNEEVRKIAKGRVWTGAQALELKLIDKLGGFKEAIEEAKILAKIPKGKEVKIVVIPKEKSFFEVFLQKEEEDTLKTLIKNYIVKDLPFGPLWCPYKLEFD